MMRRVSARGRRWRVPAGAALAREGVIDVGVTIRQNTSQRPNAGLFGISAKCALITYAS